MDNNSYKDILSRLSNSSLSEAQKNKSAEGLLSSLPKDDRDKINSVLSNPEKLKQLLSSPKAQQLFKSLGGDKK